MTAQDIIVLGIVLAAMAYLGRVLILSVSGRKSCGGCGSGKKCGSTAAGNAGGIEPAASEQLIQIGLGSGFSPGRNGHAAISVNRKREDSTSGH